MRPLNRIIAVIFFLLFSAAGLQAQTGTVIQLTAKLDGAANQLRKDSAVTVTDQLYFDPSVLQIADTPYAVKNTVTFKLNEYSGNYAGQPFTATAVVKIIYAVSSNNVDSINKSFTINYRPDSSYNLEQSLAFKGAHEVTVQMVSLSINGDTAQSPMAKLLQVQNTMEIKPAYKFFYTASAIRTVSFTHNTASADELQVSWPNITGADEYDLEWAYVDSSALGRYVNKQTGQPDPNLIFRNNASRITTTNISYNIPLIYDNGGVLYFRVRAVQRLGAKGRLEARWSSDFTPFSQSSFAFEGHERTLNWQSNTSYAEDGKRKVVVQYYDGSLRNRQTVTKDNTVNKTIVSETYYDQQGRPAIQVMPAPTLNSIIGYTKLFNTNAANAEYDKQQYDSLPDASAFCTASANPMNTAAGAALYYSANNPEINTGLNKYIPDASGYVFTETEYTQDNTGRINRQSGVGPNFKLGSGHETKYYYGSPSQDELDALFGTEVGDKSHYFKNMVRDANGQYSVSYVDMHGRTIATALAGTVPDSIKLSPLSSYHVDTITESINNPAQADIRDLTTQSSKSLLVSVGGNYHFTYHLDSMWFNQANCSNANVKYDCLYDLDITITDDCNNQKLGGAPFKKVLSNYTVGSVVPNNPTTQPFNLSFDVYLEPGNYEVTKKLTVSRYAIDYYRDSVFVPNNTCTSLEQIMAQQRVVQHIGSNCEAIDTAVHSQVDAARVALLLDMTVPSGQYANPADSTDPYSIFYANPSVDNYQLPYQATSIQYLDEKGYLDTVYCLRLNAFVKPQQLSPLEFAAAFKPSWAEALLKLHPEYCKLSQSLKRQASMRWDVDFGATDTYQEAFNKGYLNPTGNTSFPFNRFPAGKIDPLSQESTSIKQQLEDKLLHYQATQNNAVLTMWAMAGSATLCSSSDQGCMLQYANGTIQSFSPGSCKGDLDMQWRNFRQLYLSVKNGIYSDFSTSCPEGGNNAPYTNPTAAHLINATPVSHQPNFISPTNAQSLYLGYTNGDINQVQTSVQTKMDSTYTANCNAYIQQWIRQLTPCTEYDNAALQAITDSLVKVCIEGADADHPFGASSVKPSSTYHYKTFDDVITAYNNAHGIPTNVNCNSDVITAPLPYNQQAYSNAVNYAKPDSCQCASINNLNHIFQADSMGYTSFNAYLKGEMNINMSDSDVNELLNMCNTASNCKYLSHPISLPPAFQCNTGNTCATCLEVDTLYNQFTRKYNITPTLADTSQTQQQNNQLFANFMNNHLGFAMTAADYISFKQQCDTTPHSSIDTCIGTIVNAPINTYQLQGCSATSIFDVVRLADGSYVMAGNAKNAITGDLDALLVKVDSTGKAVWARRYGGSYNDEFDRIKLTSDGGYVTVGYTMSFNASGGSTSQTMEMRSLAEPLASSASTNNKEIFVVKFNAQGDTLWSKALGFGTAYGEIGRDVIQVDNGDIIVSGMYNYTTSTGGTDKWLLASLTNAGTYKWIKILGNDNNAQESGYLLNDSDTTFLLSGTTFETDATAYDGVLLRVGKSSGQIVGYKKYDIRSTIKTDNGNFSASTNWFGDVIKTDNGYRVTSIITLSSGSASPQRQVELDIQSNGDIISAHQMEQFSSADNGGGSLIHNADGTYTVEQFTVGTNSDIYWVKLDAAYNILQAQQLVLPGQQMAYKVLQNPDGSYVTCGTSNNIPLWVHMNSQYLNGYADSSLNKNNTPTVASASIDAGYTIGVDSYLTNQWHNIPINLTNTSFQQQSLGGTTTDCVSAYTGPRLCGKALPAVYPITAPDINNCSDSTAALVSASTIILNAYTDSLKGSFDSAYIARCLQAYQHESFNVSYTNSEYHYTLYYYDQAGNLVKTVPPQSVTPNRSASWLANVKNARNNGQSLVPSYAMTTQYRYNTLNQVVAQQSPDGGTSQFWYDRLGRLAVSQNAKQALFNQYSYTDYDYLGRITQVGQVTSSTAISDAISRNDNSLQDWKNAVADSKEQVTQTVYDIAKEALSPVFQPVNLRNRVSWTALYNNATDLNRDSAAAATYYSYDIHGNVDTLLQDYSQGIMATTTGNRFKKLVYDYDLVSGKVNSVAYQPGQKDAFYHSYEYDAENRLTDVRTSQDSLHWEHDAHYDYYRHGPLAKTTLGHLQVQGLDYAYTLQGWLKAINPVAVQTGGVNGNGANCGSASTTAVNDLNVNARTSNTPSQYTARNSIMFNDGFETSASDSFVTSLNSNLAVCNPPVDNSVADGSTGSTVSADAFNLLLNYYNNDYTGIQASLPSAFINNQLGSSFRPLYNGNISSIGLNVGKLSGPMLYNYQYDQLNRLVGMDAYRSGTVVFTSLQLSNDYRERLSYDGNGKILNFSRWGSGRQLDSAVYNYYANTNQLEHISDPVGKVTDDDVGNQGISNYKWDAIGEVVQDLDRGLTNARWTVYGKIASQTLSNGTTINYTYDAAGNRISKTVSGANGYTEWYVRDASGNVLSIYRNTDSLRQTEVNVYGSSLIGTKMLNRNVQSLVPVTNGESYFVRGQAVYYVTDHRGNTMVTVSDRRIPHSSDGSVIDYFMPLIVNAQDYSSFGALLDSRQYGHTPRYTYNGKQLDQELGWQDYGMRQYMGGAVPVFASVDPLTKDYPWYTPYQFAGNKPIWAIDLDGAEEWGVIKANMDNRIYEAKLRKADPIHAEDIILKNNLIGAGAVGLGLLLPLDLSTGGNVTRTLGTLYTGSQIAGSAEHNRATTPEGRAEQDKRSKEKLAEGIMALGLTEMAKPLGKLGEALFGKAAAKTGGNAFRYMTEAELKAVQSTGLLRGGRAGETFFTKDLYKSAAGAQNRLALPTAPTLRVEFQILNNPTLLRNGTKVLPANGMMGKGAEFMTLDPVKVKLINWQPLR